ncbi:MAG: sensor histidine kinase [Saprospiraceae bacterium]|nr:sensor histidine kinase [Saprospiraceae bacterium]
MLKNPTPQQIAWYASLISIVGVLALSIILLLVGIENRSFTYFLILGVSLFVLIYNINIFYLRKYIYRKIKLIYKTIHQEKVAPEEKNKSINIHSNIIEDVEKEVADWAENQQKELNKYKTWAEYRRNFMGDISHELKTPIFNIQGYVESLLDGGLEDESVNRLFLKRAATNIQRLQTIVEDLESISRLESGDLILEMQVFDIKELTREVFEDLEMKAKNQNIRLDYKDGASNSFKVRADREKIRQVLNNLVNNSLKYGVDEGRTKVGFYDMDRHILIEVADNGIGIARQHINHVFDRFYRVDKSRSRQMGGSGLGLSIVKHIVDSLKQTINVRSTPELGSTFGFTLEKV